MITAHSSVVGLPPGKYNLAKVLEHMAEQSKHHRKRHATIPERDNKRTPEGKAKRREANRMYCRITYYKSRAEEWMREMEIKDPEGFRELWIA